MTPSSTPGTGSGTSSEADRRDDAASSSREDPAPTAAPRPRPVGGAAAWRLRPLAAPARPEEERVGPERTRYGRKGPIETVSDWITEGRAHPVALLFAALLLGGWVLLRLITPEPLSFEAIEAGQCLYVRTGSAASLDASQRPIGTPELVRAAVLLGGAEPAPCDGSHGHEVASRTGYDRAFDDRFPGERALLAAAEAPCEAAFLVHVGRPLAGSSLALTIVVPDERRWAEGFRDALCLVHRADGQFLRGPARGSGS